MTAPAYEHNGRAVARETFYAIACDPRRSVAVEACAGSGKTWMLVSRILRALLAGSAPHEILAITFTKKAAAEMRQRLQEWLAEFAHATPEQLDQELSARGLQPTPVLREALQNLYQSVLAVGHPVQIRTFHGWFAALLRTAPMSVLQELGLPTQYELLENDSQAIALVWRRFNRAVLADAVAQQDYRAAVAQHGRHQTLKALETALSKRVEFALADAHGVVDASVRTFGDQFPDFANLDDPDELLAHGAPRQTFALAAVALGRAPQPSFSAKGGELEQALHAGDVDAMLAALLTKDGEPRKFSEKVAGIEQVRAAQDIARQVLGARAQHQAWLHQQRMARLTRVLAAQYAALKRERGWIDMNDVERAALVLLTDATLSGWVQERLDARIRHLMIDEFQDTSPLQWQALSAWLGGYVGAGGGGAATSVFIVGDPKQSIYRFRRAEPQVFRAAQHFVVEGLGGDRLSCDHTRRNATSVTAMVNSVMLAAQAAGEYDNFRAHSTESGEAGELLSLPRIERDVGEDDARAGEPVWRDSLTQPRVLPEENRKLLECRQAALWLAGQIAAGVAPGDVMVLARKRERLRLMAAELQAMHIPNQQPEQSDLAQMPEVQDIIALLDALVSPDHDLSLARALKSPLFGVSDADLVQIALQQRAWRAEGEPVSAWFDILQRGEGLPPNLAGIGQTLLQWQGWLDRLPPHDALDAIYHHGDVLARFVASAPAPQREAVLANLRALLSAALALDGGRYATPYAFIRALKAGGVKAPVRAHANAVRLLTIHGAKGLEAPLVLMLDTDGEATRTETMGVLVDWPGESELPARFVFLASETRPPACVAEALAVEQAARQREELNALYVALTRARSRLVISSIAPHSASPNSWWQRLQPLCQPVTVAATPLSVQTTADSGFLMRIVPVAPVNIAQEAIKTIATLVADASDDASSAVGLAMHRLLERQRASGLDAKAGTRAIFSDTALLSVAHEFALDPDQVAQAKAMAQRILAGEGAWAWRADELGWQGNEVALVHGGQMLRLDRLVQHQASNTWWVLDYKSTEQPQRQPVLVAQLRQYRAAVRAAYPGQSVRAAFLTGGGGMIEVDGPD